MLIVLLGASAVGADAIQDFLRRHWSRPLAPQGPPPARYSPLEASLHPDACGSCHPAQLADWRESLHAAAMGPGVAGQLIEMRESDPQSALSCFTCHGPLAEQAPIVAQGDTAVANPEYDAVLGGKGLPCAGCHVRGHERFGPPRRDGSLTSGAPPETLPHGGVTRTPAFLKSEFCRDCHQFTSDGFALNGKLLENTYNEWKASRFAREGVQCQDCHMPARRHQWRGIHDAEMVRSGLTISAKADAPRYQPGDVAVVRLRVTSTRVGHAFPTYVTPRVVLSGELVDGVGQPIAGSRQEKIIGREVALDLSREAFDTRLSPGRSATLEYRIKVPARGARARLAVTVEPDAFYAAFFEVLLRQGAGRGEAQIRQALDAARRSPFTVFERELPLGP
jgi:nitrate/TMAO reductase-like tetraheme cytochrome c subunit